MWHVIPQNWKNRAVEQRKQSHNLLYLTNNIYKAKHHQHKPVKKAKIYQYLVYFAQFPTTNMPLAPNLLKDKAKTFSKCTSSMKAQHFSATRCTHWAHSMLIYIEHTGIYIIGINIKYNCIGEKNMCINYPHHCITASPEVLWANNLFSVKFEYFI